MKTKNINEILGNLLIVIGASKIVMVFLILIGGIGILSGSSSIDYSETYEKIANIIGTAEVITIIACIVMLIINNKKQTGVTKGYKYALQAALTELLNIIPILNIFVGILVCMQYIKAGNRIKIDNSNYYPAQKDKAMLARSDWFYSESENNEKLKKELFKYTQKKEKIDEEIAAWRELVNIGEITEEIFLQETKKLTEKSKELEEQINRYN